MLENTPFDTDIDRQFNEAESTFYLKLGIQKDTVQFLKRPDQEERMYEEMERIADGEDDNDGDKVIDDLEKQMIE